MELPFCRADFGSSAEGKDGGLTSSGRSKVCGSGGPWWQFVSLIK